MTMPRFLTVLALIAAFCACGTAGASSIFMTPAFSTAAPSESVVFEVWMDFEQVTIGGGFDIEFDPEVLSFESWTGADLGDPDFQRDPDVFDGLLGGIAFGDFGGITGLNLIGTLKFSVLPDVPAGVTTAIELSQRFCFQCEFVDLNTFQIIDVDFIGAELKIVPLPAGVVLFAGALAALGAAGQRRRPPL